MSGDDSSAITVVSKIDFGDPLYLHTSDTTGTPIISVKLKGTENYSIWSRSMMLALSTKNKVGFVDGTCIKNADNPVLASQWDRCNSVVLSWILGSISEDLYSGQIYSTVASVVWTELKETYDKVDGSMIFNLHSKLNSLKQNGISVSDYYHNLNSLLKQYDEMVKIPVCTCADDDFMQIRSNLLLRDPLPDVKAAFAVISREESHRKIASNSFSNKNQNHNSAFVSQVGNSGSISLIITSLRCYEIVGYPSHYKKPANQYNRSFSSNNSTTNVSSSVSDNSDATTPSSLSSLTNEQMLKLLSLLNEPAAQSSNACANMEGKIYNMNTYFNENFNRFFNSHSTINDNQGWIIDSGANQHMTVSEKELDNIIDISDFNLKVSHPNGTEAQVRKIGNLKLTSNIILYDVLVVLGYCVSLLSVSKLVQDNELFVGFDRHKCYIQDLMSRNTLGTGSLHRGLYLFDKGDNLCYSTAICDSALL
ncbi:uncharacterized protein [Rutidosis leptorrhynchoides]|uniref:uncharacterized protein n=1 Tax=Rutidosis leptorrhynchoides TaxID=125765 RepID=UPI003A9A1FB0